MSNYNLQINWSGKDALSDSDPDKVISGDDFSTEFNAVKTAVNSKAELAGSSGQAFAASTLTATTVTGTTVSATNLNVGGTAVTSTATELNLLDGKSFKDEDDMSSDSATGIASQQSIKAYVDNEIAGISQFQWNVSNVNTAFTANGYTYTLPSNCVGVSVHIYTYMGSNQGGRTDVDIKDGATVLYTVKLGGANELNGNDGGSGMSASSHAFLPVPSNATSLYFKRGTGGRDSSCVLEQSVTKA